MTDIPRLGIEAVAQAIAAHDGEPALPCDPVPVVDGLALRRALGRKQWGVPVEFGCCGWQVDGLASGYRSRILVTGDHQSDTWPDLDGLQGHQWIHASISRSDTTPTYDDLKLMHFAVFGDRTAYQVFVPQVQHVNIHTHALHLWGRVDGVNVLPNFGRFGTI
jgi:hypothetical protein